jgi:hypothetical protein
VTAWLDDVLIGTVLIANTVAPLAMTASYVGLWARTGAADFRNIKAWRLAMP